MRENQNNNKPLSNLENKPVIDKNFDYSDYSCDVTFENTLCLKQGKQVILPPAKHENLLVRYSFDSGKSIDTSGNQLHAKGNFMIGPGISANGNSAYFLKSYLQTPIISLGTEFTIGMSIFVISYETSLFNILKTCPIISQGMYQNHSGLTAAINIKSHNLEISYRTTSGSEMFKSNSKLKQQIWYRVVLTKYKRKMILYINGVVDKVYNFGGDDACEYDNLYFGGSPVIPASAMCDLPFYLDSISIYDVQLPKNYIQAESSGYLASTEPSEFHLSCTKCTLVEAQEGCSDAYHVCSSKEIEFGIYNALSQLGLIKNGELLHTQDEEGNLASPGLGVCCLD